MIKLLLYTACICGLWSNVQSVVSSRTRSIMRTSCFLVNHTHGRQVAVGKVDTLKNTLGDLE